MTKKEINERMGKPHRCCDGVLMWTHRDNKNIQVDSVPLQDGGRLYQVREYEGEEKHVESLDEAKRIACEWAARFHPLIAKDKKTGRYFDGFAFTASRKFALPLVSPEAVAVIRRHHPKAAMEKAGAYKRRKPGKTNTPRKDLPVR